MSDTPIADAIKKKKRFEVTLVACIVFLAIGLTGLGTAYVVDHYAEKDQNAAIREVTENLEALCREGKIDCEGQRGLPGSKGKAGTSTKNVDCVRGQFKFTFTNGTTRSVGDCIAERGPRGLQGPRGHVGPAGPQGNQGPRGHRGHRGPRGRDGKTVKIVIPGVPETFTLPLDARLIWDSTTE